MNLSETIGGRFALELVGSLYLLLKKKKKSLVNLFNARRMSIIERGLGVFKKKKKPSQPSACRPAVMGQKGKLSSPSRGSDIKGGVSCLSAVFVGPHLDSCPLAIVWRWVGGERLLSQTLHLLLSPLLPPCCWLRLALEATHVSANGALRLSR